MTPGIRVGQHWVTFDGDITYEVLSADSFRVKCKIIDVVVSKRTNGNRLGKQPELLRDWLVEHCRLVKDDFLL